MKLKSSPLCNNLSDVDDFLLTHAIQTFLERFYASKITAKIKNAVALYHHPAKGKSFPKNIIQKKYLCVFLYIKEHPNAGVVYVEINFNNKKNNKGEAQWQLIDLKFSGDKAKTTTGQYKNYPIKINVVIRMEQTGIEFYERVDKDNSNRYAIMDSPRLALEKDLSVGFRIH